MPHKSTQITDFFASLSVFLSNEITPIASQLDSDLTLLKKMQQKLVALGDLAFLIPHAYGGIGGGRDERIAYNILMSQHSGALLFLHTQHQHAMTKLKELLPNAKVAAVLKKMATSQQG